jgi:hypothetical protein
MKFDGQYLLLEAALPHANTEYIGVLLLEAASDRLHGRFRRDFEDLTGDDADWFNALPDHILQTANELGARKCVEWLESTLSNALRISDRQWVVIEDNANTTLAKLYAKYIRPKVLPFRTHLPQYSLDAAAGKFGKQTDGEPEGWVEVRTDIPLTNDMFVVHVEGHSMEPQIPHASLCVFQSKTDDSWDGKIMLLEEYDESGGHRYTLRLCHVSNSDDPNRAGDEEWLHPRLTLNSNNPGYGSWDIPSDRRVTALGEFLFVV